MTRLILFGGLVLAWIVKVYVREKEAELSYQRSGYSHALGRDSLFRAKAPGTPRRPQTIATSTRRVTNFLRQENK